MLRMWGTGSLKSALSARRFFSFLLILLDFTRVATMSADGEQELEAVTVLGVT